MDDVMGGPLLGGGRFVLGDGEVEEGIGRANAVMEGGIVSVRVITVVDGLWPAEGVGGRRR